MKRILVTIFIFSLPLVAQAIDEEDQYTSIEHLQSDLKQAFLVGLFHPLSISPDSSVRAMGNVYRTSSRVIESFKGNAKAGDTIEFYTVFEDRPNDFYAKMDRIVFLGKYRDEENNRWILMELDNSSREASKANIEKMRRISPESGKTGPNR